MNGEEKEKEKKAGGSGCSNLPCSGSAGSFGVVTFNERILRPEFDEVRLGEVECAGVSFVLSSRSLSSLPAAGHEVLSRVAG